MNNSRIICGDCLEVMPTLEEASADSIVCDPPYSLSNSGGNKRESDRIFDALRKIGFPDLYQRDALLAQEGDLAGVAIGGSSLGSANGAVRKGSGVGAPEGSVDFQDDSVAQHEVGAGRVLPRDGAPDADLPLEGDADAGKFLGDFILDLGDVAGIDNAGGVGSGRLAEAFFGGFAVPVVATLATGGCCLSTRCLPVVFADEDVGGDDDAPGESYPSPGVVTLPRAVNALMLRFDLGGTPLEMRATHRAGDNDGSTFGCRPQLVRALSPASRLATVAKPHRVGLVIHAADGTDTGYWLHVWTPLNSGSLKPIIPAGGFMGKGWDASLPDPEVWVEALRVAKPGAYLLAFGGTRTYHRLTCAIEDAGWEIRDCIMWVYGSGFPKSKGCLKPAYEPIILARKKGPKVLPLNIDACRVGMDVVETKGGDKFPGVYGDYPTCVEPTHVGRWPANLIHSGEDEVMEAFAAFGESNAKAGRTGRRGGSNPAHMSRDKGDNDHQETYGVWPVDAGGTAARFFYCAKASKADRGDGSNHPTVKPHALMRYLCRLVTPPGGLILDPFAGSGSTGKGAVAEGFRFIGIELDSAYCEIAERRIAAATASTVEVR
jgi:site-specific DNA-methyltransferase (adenine-specific)